MNEYIVSGLIVLLWLSTLIDHWQVRRLDRAVAELERDLRELQLMSKLYSSYNAD